MRSDLWKFIFKLTCCVFEQPLFERRWRLRRSWHQSGARERTSPSQQRAWKVSEHTQYAVLRCILIQTISSVLFSVPIIPLIYTRRLHDAYVYSLSLSVTYVKKNLYIFLRKVPDHLVVCMPKTKCYLWWAINCETINSWTIGGKNAWHVYDFVITWVQVP